MHSKYSARPRVNPAPKKQLLCRAARKSVAWPEPKPCPEGRGHLYREVTEHQSGQKRGYHDEDYSTEDVQEKRTKTITPDDGVSNISAELFFNLVSFSGLKSICAKVLEDRTAGAKLREELLSCKQNILAHSRAEACDERDGIIIAADKATDRVIEEAMQMKGMMGCDDWPTALSPLFPRIKALCNRGSLVGGPGLAWEALVEVAAFCMYQWDGGDARVQGFGEEDCDEFHDEVDKIMLSICEAQKQDGKILWLQGRRKEISGLQKKAEDQNGGSFKYRYQRSLQFLEQL